MIIGESPPINDKTRSRKKLYKLRFLFAAGIYFLKYVKLNVKTLAKFKEKQNMADMNLYERYVLRYESFLKFSPLRRNR